MADKKRKTPKARVAADRAPMIRKSNVQSGKPKASGSSKSATITRQMQNKGAKDGEIRIGRSGKTYNVYDSSSGTWKRGVVKYQGKEAKPSPRSGGSAKEGGLVRRPTNQNPSYGAGHIVGPGTNQRSGNVINNPSRRRSSAPRITRVSKKTR